MKRVQRSKEPSLRQLLNMASNLREKFRCPCSVEISAWHYDYTGDRSNRHVFGIWIAARGRHYEFDSWKECQDKYFRLIKGTEDE